jgi:hypothetical protein
MATAFSNDSLLFMKALVSIRLADQGFGQSENVRFQPKPY